MWAMELKQNKDLVKNESGGIELFFNLFYEVIGAERKNKTLSCGWRLIGKV